MIVGRSTRKRRAASIDRQLSTLTTMQQAIGHRGTLLGCVQSDIAALKLPEGPGLEGSMQCAVGLPYASAACNTVTPHDRHSAFGIWHRSFERAGCSFSIRHKTLERRNRLISVSQYRGGETQEDQNGRNVEHTIAHRHLAHIRQPCPGCERETDGNQTQRHCRQNERR